MSPIAPRLRNGQPARATTPAAAAAGHDLEPDNCTLPARTRPARPSYRLGAVSAVVLLTVAAAAWGLGSTPEPALASVQHGVGFDGTVMGWTSWYGNYGLGDLGWGWCIDHGSRAPDPAYRYVPADVADKPATTKTAIAWAVTTNALADPASAAAVMLAVHDLMGARYPTGPLDVDQLTASQLSGFGGHESEVVTRARSIKADAMAHAHLRAPFRLTVEAERARAGQSGQLFVDLHDARGAAVAGVTVWVSAVGSSLGASSLQTDARGSARVPFVAGPGWSRFSAIASIPDTTLSAYAPTTTAAQRIARPSGLRVQAATDLSAPITSTTTTSTPSTTTTRPSTTTTTTAAPSTTLPPTTTTLPPPTSTAPPTTAPPTTAPPTTAPPTTTVSTVPGAKAPPSTDRTLPPPTTTPTTSTETSTTTGVTTPPAPAPPGEQPPAGSPPTTVRGSLPFTGFRASAPLFAGTGLVLLGGSLVAFARSRKHHRELMDRPWFRAAS